ncbi:DUF420 domain-containing protein [Bythopirellula polymerisocia]|uniref:DUF420 domain-containing protein n=1 Tax=Bythopirellula polymerisocia TaxID=2528003 RepID=A0A5C6CPX4_9BACT|nr:DUF420 domain-containing protein [Bythopirellula polymerisocia]TWU25534.1 hypothetical protein Pla144_27400 [Bythopirellula polymerisocia]
MLDLVCLGMVLVLAILGWSIRLVRKHGNYSLHKKVQLTLAGLLLVVLTLFEVDIRLHGWEERAAGELGGTPSSSVFYVLWVHLFFAMTTLVLWIVVIVRALKNFPQPPLPCEHSRSHRRWAWLAAIDMLLTTCTGWVFYMMAFVL